MDVSSTICALESDLLMVDLTSARMMALLDSSITAISSTRCCVLRILLNQVFYLSVVRCTIVKMSLLNAYSIIFILSYASAASVNNINYIRLQFTSASQFNVYLL